MSVESAADNGVSGKRETHAPPYGGILKGTPVSLYTDSEKHLKDLEAVFKDFVERSDELFDGYACGLVGAMLQHGWWAKMNESEYRSPLYGRELCRARLALRLFGMLPESVGGKIAAFPQTRGALWSAMAPAFAALPEDVAKEFEQALFAHRCVGEEERNAWRKCIEGRLFACAENYARTTMNSLAALRRAPQIGMTDDSINLLFKLVSLHGSTDLKCALAAGTF